MKKSTIITILAFALGIVILSLGFILLTDNNISRKLFATTTTSPEEQPAPELMDFLNEDLSKYVTLGQYKGLDVEVDQAEVSQEYIDSQIELMLVNAKQYNEVKEGTITEKVIFSFDYTGYLTNEDGSKGEKFQGGASTGQLAYIDGTTLVTISSSGLGSFIDGFAQGILGHNVGETFDINITFPQDYSAEMAGKKTIFEIKLNYIADTYYTDEWIKEYTEGECNNYAELEKVFKESAQNEIDNTNRDLVWSKIIENATTIQIPEQQLNYVYNYFVEDIEYYMSYYASMGLEVTFDQMLSYYGFSSADELKEYAKEVVFSDLVVYAVIQAENLEITDEEYAALIAELVESAGKTEAEVVEYYGGEEAIKESMLFDKANKLVVKENNLIVK